MADVEYIGDIDSKCTCTPSNVTQVINGNTFIIEAKKGYKFNEPFTQNDETRTSPRLRFYNANGDNIYSTNAEYFSFTQTVDNKKITIVCHTELPIGTITRYVCRENVYKIETDSLPVLTLTKNLSNVTISPDVSSIELDGTSKVITLTANSGYEFSGVPKLTISNTDYNFSLSNGVYTLDVNTIGISSDVSGTITATATQIVIKPIVTITKILSNVTMTPDVSSIELDGTSKVITLTANSGYEFSGKPYFELNRYPYYFEQLGSDYIYDLNSLINENE